MSGYVAIFRSTRNSFTPGATSRDRADMLATVDARGITGADRADVERRTILAARAAGISPRALAVVDRATFVADHTPRTAAPIGA